MLDGERMADQAFIYKFEGIPDDLPRPPMSALRGLLASGVIVSARGWQDLPIETRQGLSRAGMEERLNDAWIADLLKRIPVSQVKLVGKRAEPNASVIPAELVSALGPVLPLTIAEWGAGYYFGLPHSSPLARIEQTIGEAFRGA